MSLQQAFDILEVDNTSTSEEIKQSKKRLSLQWHPDRHRTSERKSMAEKEMKKINHAFDILKNAGKIN